MHQEPFFIKKQSFIQSRRQNILDFYELNSHQLGHGAYGTVYKGREKQSTGDWRAIKRILKKSIKQPELLVNQIEILKSLDHPSCIRLYQTFEDENNVYLVTDLCEGGQLFDRLEKQGNFSEEGARIIFAQIIQAVNYCHMHHIAHRDLKPENFLFLNNQSLSLKLIDFGLSYRWKEDMRKELKAIGDKKLIGTSYYIAPQIINGSYDQRCDIWSAGVMLYILVSAAPPFDGENDREIMENVRKLNYVFDIPEMNGVSKAVKTLISKIMQPQDKRITAKDIFNDPWLGQQAPKHPLKINYNKFTNFSKYSKIKKLAASFISTQMSEKQVEDLSNLFRQIDINKDGEISVEQLKQALQADKTNVALKDLLNVIKEVDTDGNGKINYNEFLACNIDQSKLFTEERMKSMFKKLDKDASGTIDRKQLAQLLENNKDMLNGKSIDEIIKSCDKDGNGLIDFAEFKASLLN